MDVDPDKSGKVSFEEFVTLLQSTRGTWLAPRRGSRYRLVHPL